GKRITEVFKQPQYNPVPVEVQVAVLWVVQNGYVDDIALEKVKEYQNRLTEFLTTRRTDVLDKIKKEKAISDELKAELKSAADEFKDVWVSEQPQAATK
ncbi:MAG TPA: hypothetical protein VHP83_18770, partial [Aggregatilineaceae bacterium]|nr:hypothetical protein [Aggregatilineaceae bacterium]